MSAHVEFEWDSRDLAIWRSREIDFAIARAVRLAGNQAIRVAQKASIAHVTSRKMLPEDMVREGLPLIMPGRKALLRELAWREDISGTAVPLSRYPIWQTTTGVVAHVNRGRRVRVRSAFVKTLSSGHRGVFVRKTKQRFPIQELWSSKISDVMSDDGALEGAQTKASKRLDSAFARGMEREIGKLRRKGSA